MADDQTILFAGTKLLNESTEQASKVVQDLAGTAIDLEFKQMRAKLAFREFHFLSRLRTAIENFELDTTEHSKHQLLEIMSDVQFNTLTLRQLVEYASQWARFETFIHEHSKALGYYEIEVDVGLALCKAMQPFIQRNNIHDGKPLADLESLIASITYPSVLEALHESSSDNPIAHAHIGNVLVHYSGTASEALAAVKANRIPRTLKTSLTYSQRQLQMYYDLFIREQGNEKS